MYSHKQRRFPLREASLLALPALPLMVLAFGSSQRTPVLALEKVEIASLAPSGGLYRFAEPDTQVKVTLKYTPAYAYERLITNTAWAYNDQNVDSMSLDNERGWKHQMRSQGIRHVKYLGNDCYSMEFVFPLREVKPSAGKVTFNAVITGKNHLSLPVSVVVRDK